MAQFSLVTRMCLFRESVFSVTPYSYSQTPQGVQIIDGEDRFLIPGLAEMHAHIPVPQEGDDNGVKETLFLYLANGITTIRGMLGAP